MSNIVFIRYDDPRFELVRSIRTEVFTREQGASAAEEFDQYDSDSTFALLYDEGQAVATARIADTDKGIKIGRIAVRSPFRGRGLGAEIVTAVTEKAFANGADVVFVDAQNYAVPFYEKLGFSTIGTQIFDRGLAHIPMRIVKGEYNGK